LMWMWMWMVREKQYIAAPGADARVYRAKARPSIAGLAVAEMDRGECAPDH